MVVQVSLGSVVVQVSLLYHRVLWWCKLACYIQGSVVVQVSLLYTGSVGVPS